MEDCFCGETFKLNIHRYTSKDEFLTPGKPLSSSGIPSELLFFCISCKQKKKLKFVLIVPKGQTVIAAAIKSKIYNIWTLNINPLGARGSTFISNTEPLLWTLRPRPPLPPHPRWAKARRDHLMVLHDHFAKRGSTIGHAKMYREKRDY